MYSRKLAVVSLTTAILTLSSCGLFGQSDDAADYPAKEITLSVPLAAGGATDTAGRVIAKYLTEELGKPVVVENNPGAGGVIQTTELARAKPDGYTLQFSGDSLFSIQPVLEEGLGYSEDDFDFIVNPAVSTTALSVRSSSPWRSIQDLVSDARQSGKTITYAHPGTGTSPQLAGELFFKRAGVKAQQVPFDSGGAAVTGLLGNETDVLLSPEATVTPHLQSGVRVLAVASEKRSATLPDIPTMAESGYDVVMNQMYVVYGPKDIPDGIIRKIRDAFTALAANKSYQQELAKFGLMVDGRGPAEISKYFERTRNTVSGLRGTRTGQ